MCVVNERHVTDDMSYYQGAKCEHSGDNPHHSAAHYPGDLPAQGQPLRLGGDAHKAQRSYHLAIS